MRVFVYSSIFLLFFGACTQNPKSKDNGTGLTTDTPKAAVRFRCETVVGVDQDNPSSQVFLVVNDQSTKIADIAACNEIAKEDYLRHQIPANALAACGGWWAGAGDYFYALEVKGKIIVMKGWQEETQEDEGYHYEQVKSVPMN